MRTLLASICTFSCVFSAGCTDIIDPHTPNIEDGRYDVVSGTLEACCYAPGDSNKSCVGDIKQVAAGTWHMDVATMGAARIVTDTGCSVAIEGGHGDIDLELAGSIVCSDTMTITSLSMSLVERDVVTYDRTKEIVTSTGICKTSARYELKLAVR